MYFHLARANRNRLPEDVTMATVAIYDRYHTEYLQNILISLGRPIIFIIDSNIANTSEKTFEFSKLFEAFD